MRDTPDLTELVGEDVSEAELESLRRVHELLRSVPPPPEVPGSLTRSVLGIPRRARAVSSRRRLGAGLALAAALAAAAFGGGYWAGGDGGESIAAAVERVPLTPTPQGPAGAEMLVDVLPIDQAGNWALVGQVSGLPRLQKGAYYELWLTKGTKLAVSCGRFVVDESGRAKHVWLNAPYKFREYDDWVVTAERPGKKRSAWLLEGPVVVPA